MKRFVSNGSLTMLLAFCAWVQVAGRCHAAEPAQRAEAVLASSAKDNKFTYVVFYKQYDATSKAMTKTVQQGLAGHENEAVITYSQVTSPEEQALVKKFGLERTPMPMTLAVAPNGAITGIFNTKLTPELVVDALVTPVMTRCMKSMQEGKIVLVCVHRTAEPAVPQCASDFQKDAFYADRSAVILLDANDQAEARFLAQMKIEPAKTGDVIVMLAPPGMLVGQFANTTTKEQLAAALHKAGKCCDDPNCKHNK
ncbi:MAG: hypothetical protein K1X74_06370 [Pirellulales bacterium]|nr:hypothetical protein [Pirellulales bacterium]